LLKIPSFRRSATRQVRGKRFNRCFPFVACQPIHDRQAFDLCKFNPIVQRNRGNRYRDDPYRHPLMASTGVTEPGVLILYSIFAKKSLCPHDAFLGQTKLPACPNCAAMTAISNCRLSCVKASTDFPVLHSVSHFLARRGIYFWCALLRAACLQRDQKASLGGI
jgi:hypothetical protein